MKLLIVASWYYSARAPTRGSFIREQAQALAARGHEVHVVCFDRDSTERPLTIARSRDERVEEHRIAVPSPLHRVLGFYFPEVLARQLKRVIRSVDPELVHAHAVRPAGVVAALAIEQARPLVITEHSSSLRHFWWTAHGRRQIGQAYRRADQCIAVSRALRSEIERWFPHMHGRCEVVPNGVDMTMFAPHGTRQGDLLFVGALQQRKRLDLILQGVARLPERVRLTVVGTGPLERSLKALASRLQVESQVTWLGAQSRVQVARLMAAHEALILASDAETFGVVCIEALACGTRVIATHCGGPEEVVPTFGGVIVPKGDVKALSAAIAQVMRTRSENDPQKLRSYVAERYSMPTIASRLEERYQALVMAKRHDALDHGAGHGLAS